MDRQCRPGEARCASCRMICPDFEIIEVTGWCRKCMASTFRDASASRPTLAQQHVGHLLSLGVPGDALLLDDHSTRIIIRAADGRQHLLAHRAGGMWVYGPHAWTWPQDGPEMDTRELLFLLGYEPGEQWRAAYTEAEHVGAAAVVTVVGYTTLYRDWLRTVGVEISPGQFPNRWSVRVPGTRAAVASLLYRIRGCGLRYEHAVVPEQS